MEETKLIKLLDLALERIDYLEAEAIDKGNETLDQKVKDLEKENKELQDYYERKQKQLKKAIEEKDGAIFELQSKLEKVVDQRNELVIETANAGEVAQIKKENENLKTTNADLLKRLEEAAEANDRLAYDLSNSEVFIELRNENEKLSNMIRMLKTDKGILEDKLEELAKKSGESSPAKWNDILDPTKRPRPNEPVLITTKSGKIIIGSFEVDGNIRSSGKPTKATAWMKLPKPFTK